MALNNSQEPSYDFIIAVADADADASSFYRFPYFTYLKSKHDEIH